MKKAILAAILLIVAIAAAAGTWVWFTSRAASGDASTPAPQAAVSKPSSLAIDQAATQPNPTHRYPRIVGGNFDHEDQTSIDETVAMREFKIPLEGDDAFYVTAAYRSYLGSRADLGDKITVLADMDAAFSEAYSTALPSPQPGVTLRLHVGDFAQDDCGAVNLVYTMQTSTIVAIAMGDGATQERLLENAQCTMERDSDDEHFCAARAQCLNAYLTRSLAEAPIDSALLQRFARLQLQ